MWRLANGEGPSGAREPRPWCSHSLFEARFESPTRAPSGTWRGSPWERAKVPVGARDPPSGTSEAPSGRWASTEWDPRVGPCRGRLDLVAADSTLNGARYALATSLQGRRRRQKARREHRPPMQPQQGSL